MRSFIHRLEVKFVLLATIIIIIGAVIISYIIYTYESNEHYEMARTRAELLASFASHAIIDHLDTPISLSGKNVPTAMADILEQVSDTKASYIKYLNIFDSNLETVFVYSDSAFHMTTSHEKVESAFAGDTVIIIDTVYQKETLIEVYEPIRSDLKNIGLLSLIVSSEEEQMGLHELADNLVTITVVVIVFSVLMAVIVARTLAKPIKILTREMETVESPYYETSLRKNRKDELGTLQERFLVMLDRLKKSEREKEKARSSLIQAEKMASIGTLASGIAHEINNPLAGLKQSIHRIMVNPENVAQTKKYVSMINNALVHIENVVKGLLDFSRKRELTLRKTDINEVLEDAMRMLDYQIKNNDINCVKLLDRNLGAVLGDVYYLEQVFINLLLNAIDAMPDGGQLTVRSYSADTRIVVEIEDTGTGIEESQLAQVFDPFFTTKEEGKGTGLGLAICYSIVKDHGGEIAIESQSGVGTKVAITLVYA